MAFAEVEKHNGTPVDIITYKTEWKGLIGNNGSFWSSLRPYLLFWSQEVYTWCQYVCVGGTSTLGQKSSRTNEYVEHPARLAFAAGAPAGAANARGFFDVGYQPVENVFWATSSNQSVFMTQFLTLDQIERFASLQVFATRAWAQFNAYPDRRFAFAWNEHPFPTGINANGKRMALATRIAKALRGAYSLNGSALFACDPGGISTSRCNPVLSGASFTAIWASFGSWG